MLIKSGGKCDLVFHLTEKNEKKDFQLRWFQYRIFHRILATNPHTIQRWFYEDSQIQF